MIFTNSIVFSLGTRRYYPCVYVDFRDAIVATASQVPQFALLKGSSTSWTVGPLGVQGWTRIST